MSPTSTDQLQGGELVTVAALSFLLTPLAGAFYYYKWKDSQPNKAKTANRIAWLSFIIWGIAIGILQWLGYINILD